MKELVVVSGKGGTGKTSVSAALAYLAPKKVLVDCDVDAANLHLVIGAAIREQHGFTAGFEPVVDEKLCTGCGVCTEVCRFGAVRNGDISMLDCEGCGVCAMQCPVHAVSMKEKEAGEWFRSETRFGPLIHAELGMAVENSGKLVSKVRKEGKLLAEEKKLPMIITDGPPGIGCPAIAALSGATLALAVVEPSQSGIHDVKRLAALISHFSMPMMICINKSTLHYGNTKEIIRWCHSQGLPVVGQIPYSDVFMKGMQVGCTVMEMEDEEVKKELRNLWQALAQWLNVPTELTWFDRINPF